jgi:NhaA family Na+:H+ antiporter
MNRPLELVPEQPLLHLILDRVERFLNVEAASGVILLIAAAVALGWANSPWAHSYEALWDTPLTFGIGSVVSLRTLHFWVNDGLMTIFFLLVGLEIRREMHDGTLSDPKIATLPIVAALAGVLVPALIYVLINTDPVARRGWAVPTATDIAFAVGVLSLVGSGIPRALRMLLLTLAIVDDIAAIVVIALFYSSGIALSGLLIAACGVLGVLALQHLRVRRALVYVLPGAILWFGLLRTGVHPTLAGVVLGLLTPVRLSFGSERVLAAATRSLEEIRERMQLEEKPDTHELLPPVRRLRHAQREILPPVVRVQAALHPWVAYAIMPLFALANAGVHLQRLGGQSGTPLWIGVGIVAGLVLGKPIGIILSSLAAVRLGWCALPAGVSWCHIALLGCLGGIGFTMAIFVANLAFPQPAWLLASKLGVLVGSTLAAVVGLTLGRLVPGVRLRPS